MRIVNFNTTEKSNIEEGTILEFLASDYQYDTKSYINVFKVIGNPAGKGPSIEVKFN